ncbi:MAG: phosphoenolpyruvate kinase [Bacteroidetes bacterium]|jgi:citrate lyase beta subunit|nr:phosphoenolpyruvate kinase [Bacteroidota bacterium]
MIDERQPVHVVYGGAHLFKASTVPKLGGLAVRHLEAHAKDAFVFAEAVGLPEASLLPRSLHARIALLRTLTKGGEQARVVHPAAWTAFSIHRRVLEKLRSHAVEDLRIDFEDGYGFRSDADEDFHAVRTAQETVEAMAAGSLPPCFGIRVKPFAGSSKPRARRTLELYLQRLLTRTEGRLPSHFVVTLPKIATVEEVFEFVRLLEALERTNGLPARSLRLEIMVETPQMIVSSKGASLLPDVLAACDDRCRGLHLGLYDYLSSMDVVASAQSYRHPMADHLRVITKAAAASTRLWLSDGATNRIPLGPHRGEKLTKAQGPENQAAVHAGWREIFANVEHSLHFGYDQGWDLHPSQLPPRYAAVFGMFIREEETTAVRLRSFLEMAAQAMLRGQQFDDAATAQGSLNFFRRGIAAGALNEDALLRAGLRREELRSRSFAEIIDGRRRDASRA